MSAVPLYWFQLDMVQGLNILTVLVESDSAELQSTPAQIHAATAAKPEILGDPSSFRDYLSLFPSTAVLCLSRAS